MDVNCDYLVVSGFDTEPDDQIHSCPHCSSARYLRRALVYEPADGEWSGISASISVRPVTFEEASYGRMVPYLLSHETRDDHGTGPEEGDKTLLYYVVHNNLASIQGPVHLRDTPEYGTWLTEVDRCSVALGRLRSAASACAHLPDLKRFVLEQKNDDGLLHLASKWLAQAKNSAVGIEAFGPFFIDVAFAPILHKIMRSDWLAKRKSNCGTSNELKPGWAQEFYNASKVSRSPDGKMRFVGHPTCLSVPLCVAGEGKGPSGVAQAILREMRLCGYTPWSAVHAVRCHESSLHGLSCPECRRVIFTHCAFLMECAALEASLEHDWLVRNEAVIQLCWVVHSLLSLEIRAAVTVGDLSAACSGADSEMDFEDVTTEGTEEVEGEWDIGEENEQEDEKLKEQEQPNEEGGEGAPFDTTRCRVEAKEMDTWAFLVTAHCVAFQTHERNCSLDLEKLAVLYANDHFPSTLECENGEEGHTQKTSVKPDPRLFEMAALNNAFNSPRLKSGNCLQERDMRVPPAGKVLYGLSAPRRFYGSGSEDQARIPNAFVDKAGRIEARGQDPEVIADAFGLHFPKVSPSALCHLSLKAPQPSSLRADASLFWPVFVNPTRSCHKLFKALALPVSPSPAYALETLARGWRRVPDRVRGEMPTATGGWVTIPREHYERYFKGPLDLLTGAGLMSESEKGMMLEALSKGVLPCFAAEGESLPDTLVSSTLALSFAASGLRLFASGDLAGGGEGRQGVKATARSAVRGTVAGLLYFAAWYVLVYGNALHSGPCALKVLAREAGGNDANRHLCAAMELKADRCARITPARGDGGGDADLDLFCEYSVWGYDDGSIVKAMLIIFEGLLDARTVLRAAQLYVPELTAQLPFSKALNSVPSTVKSAIEARDAWFAARQGGVESSRGDPPYIYLGDVAHGIHSSLRGALDDGDERPVAAPPASLDAQDSDPWYACLLYLNESDDREGSHLSYVIQDLERMTVLNDPECWENILEGELPDVDLGIRCPDSADGTRQVAARSESVARGSPHVAGGVAPGDPAVQGVARSQLDSSQSTLEKLLVVDSLDNLGFAGQSIFPRETADIDDWRRSDGASAAPSLRRPCLTNVWNTTYTRTHWDGMRNSKPALRSSRSRSYRTLAEALWVMFIGAYGCKGSHSAPLTVEALAVIIHLASKIIDNGSISGLGPCKDIRALCCHLYPEPRQFLPVASVAAGMFGCNVAVCSRETFYCIRNSHHENSWVQGFLECDGSSWHLRDAPLHTTPIELLFEIGPRHRAGSLQAYARLHDLEVINVPSDGYCGFHSVAQLLYGRMATDEIRVDLVKRMADFVFLNAGRSDIRETYLPETRARNISELERQLSEEKRWLSVQELGYMLEAHGKCLGLLTDTSYPIYDKACAHIVWTQNHYEPLKPKMECQRRC